MKHYYKIPGRFWNEYGLIWADETNAAHVPSDAEPITRRRALELVRAERWARKNDPDFAGFASSRIYPADYTGVLSYTDTPADRYLTPDPAEPGIIDWTPGANRAACNRRCGEY